jgi:hypothetical protein
MRLLSDSTIQEYARQFWRRQRRKQDPNDTEALTAIDAGADPVVWLRSKYDYKLPRPHNDLVNIVLMTNQSDVADLLVHDYMPSDHWMKERGLVPQPFTRRLGLLAAACLERGYFASPLSDRPIQNFREWKTRASLADVIDSEELTMIEAVGADGYEIVDGWGRLLPFAALLVQGSIFAPFRTFALLCPEFLIVGRDVEGSLLSRTIAELWDSLAISLGQIQKWISNWR